MLYPILRTDPRKFGSFGPTALWPMLIYAVTTLPLAAASVTLAWDPSPEPALAGYRLYYGTARGIYSHFLEVGNIVSATVSNLIAGETYYFAATAYDTNGLESHFSSEISYTPVALRRLTINSTASSSTVWISIPGSAGPDGAATPSERTYGNNTMVQLLAPVTEGTNTFKKWIRDGVALTTNLTVNITMNADHSLLAMYNSSLRLKPIWRGHNYGFELAVETEDGTPMDLMRLNRLTLWATTDVSLPLSAWSKLSARPIVTNNAVTLTTGEGLIHARRFFQLVEE